MLVASAALAALALLHGTTTLIVVALSLLGVGIGLFTPTNNAAIMGAVPREQAGAASGILNMTRGLGTSLGFSLTGLVLAAASGSRAGGSIVHGYTEASLVLVAVALVAGLLASTTRSRPIEQADAETRGSLSPAA